MTARMLNADSIKLGYELSKLCQFAYADLTVGAPALDPSSISATANEQKKLPLDLARRVFGLNPKTDTPIWTVLSPWYKTGGNTGHSDPDSGFAGKPGRLG